MVGNIRINNMEEDMEMSGPIIPENGEYMGEINVKDIFEVSVVEPLIEEYEMPVGLYLLGNAGGMIGVGLAHEVLHNYNIEGIDLRFYALNSARVDFSLLRKRFPQNLRKKLKIIPIGIKEDEYMSYIELVKKKKILEYKLEELRKSNNLQEARQVMHEIYLINRKIKAMQKKLSGSGSLIDAGLSKFQASYSLLEKYFSSDERYEDAQILIGSFAGGTGSALFVEMSKLIKQVNRDSLRIAYGLTPFKSERKKNSLRVQNYIKAVQGTRPNVNLLIEIDPSHVSEQIEKSQNRGVNFVDLNMEFGKRNAQFLLTLMLTNRATEFTQVTWDFMDLKRIVNENAVGDLAFYNNRTPNGGYMTLIETVKQKLLPDIIKMPSRVLVYYDIPKSETVPEVERTNNIITESTDAVVYFGVTQRVGDEDKEIRLYTVAIRDDDEKSQENRITSIVESSLYSDSVSDISAIDEF